MTDAAPSARPDDNVSGRPDDNARPDDTARYLPMTGPPRRRPRAHESYVDRRARNIASWRAYLSEDCIAAMVAMGWDRTT